MATCANALLPVVILAQGFPGAKPDLVSSGAAGSGGSGIGSLFNVLLALGIVYGLLRFAMPKLAARFNKRLVSAAGSSIRIEESASFAGGSLYVVAARERTLLLSVSSTGVQCLADLSETKGSPEPPTFGDLVEREMAKPEAAVRPSSPDWAVALERLEKLAS